MMSMRMLSALPTGSLPAQPAGHSSWSRPGLSRRSSRRSSRCWAGGAGGGQTGVDA